jgi:YVTN family beta-propeller protein
MRLLVLLLLCSLHAAAQKATLAVVQKVSGTVGFYAADGKHLKDVKVGAYPHEAIVSPDGRFLYVTDNGILWMQYAGEGGNTISIIDLASMTNAGVIDLGDNRRPHGIDIHPKTGRIVVTTENPDGIVLVDPVARKVLRRFDVKGTDPHMVLFSPDGEWAYVSNAGSATVAAVNLSTGDVKLIATDGGPQGGVFSHDGHLLYIANGEGHSISVIDTAAKERVGVIPTGKRPGRLALTPDGKTLIYNLGEDNAVAFADIASRKQTASIPVSARPMSLRMSADATTVYSGIQEKDEVVAVSVAERKITAVIKTPKESGPDTVVPLR